jgi:DNA-binding HxlR family transcriptional regulator
MTSTLDVIKSVLNSKWALKILDALCESNLTFTHLKKTLRVPHNNQISRTVNRLDKLALVDHVFTKSGDFYRISARGKRILEIIRSIEKDAPIEAIC